MVGAEVGNSTFSIVDTTANVAVKWVKKAMHFTVTEISSVSVKVTGVLTIKKLSPNPNQGRS